MKETTKKALVLSSGGLDSTTCLGVARGRGYHIYSLTFDYGQKHLIELESARKVAEFFGVKRHIVFPLDLKSIGGSALTGNLDVPKHGHIKDLDTGVPDTYVPARNMIFLSIAAAFAETLGAETIFAGMNSIDYSGYPDCRPEFVASFQNTLDLGTKIGSEGNGIRIETPLIKLAKKEIIQLGLKLGVDYSLTWSCYDPVERWGETLACGRCDSCLLRLHGFKQAGATDPIQYI